MVFLGQGGRRWELAALQAVAPPMSIALRQWGGSIETINGAREYRFLARPSVKPKFAGLGTATGKPEQPFVDQIQAPGSLAIACRQIISNVEHEFLPGSNVARQPLPRLGFAKVRFAGISLAERQGNVAGSPWFVQPDRLSLVAQLRVRRTLRLTGSRRLLIIVMAPRVSAELLAVVGWPAALGLWAVTEW